MYTLQDLCDQFGVTRYAIKKYIRMGVLPQAKGRGPTTYYTDEHARMLRRVRSEVHDRSRLTDLAERRLYESGQRA